MYDDFVSSLHFSNIYRLVGEVLRLAKGRLLNSVNSGSGIGKDQWDNQVDIGRIEGGGLVEQSIRSC